MRRALAILALARAYEVYENEYANDVLPGGRGDDDLPNLPYAVDANRYSDGVSSVSPLTDTAPAFPLHRGAVSDAPDFAFTDQSGNSATAESRKRLV